MYVFGRSTFIWSSPACTACLLMFNIDFVGSTNTINMFNFIDIYSFIPASGCVQKNVGRDPQCTALPKGL